MNGIRLENEGPPGDRGFTGACCAVVLVKLCFSVYYGVCPRMQYFHTICLGKQTMTWNHISGYGNTPSFLLPLYISPKPERLNACTHSSAIATKTIAIYPNPHAPSQSIRHSDFKLFPQLPSVRFQTHIIHTFLHSMQLTLLAKAKLLKPNTASTHILTHPSKHSCILIPITFIPTHPRPIFHPSTTSQPTPCRTSYMSHP